MIPSNSKPHKPPSFQTDKASPKSTKFPFSLKLSGLQYSSPKNSIPTKDTDIFFRTIQSASTTNRAYKEQVMEGYKEQGRKVAQNNDNAGDLNSKIRNLFTEKTDTVRKKPSLEKRRQLSGSTKAKEQKPEKNEQREGNYFNISKLPLSSASAAMLRFQEGNKESLSKRGSNTDRETDNNVPLSARLPSEGTARTEIVKKKSKKRSEGGKKTTEASGANKVDKAYEVFEQKLMKNKPSSFKKNIVIEALISGSRSSTTNTPKDNNKVKSSTYREQQQQQHGNKVSGEYFIKTSNGQTPKGLSPRDISQKIEAQNKLTSSTPKTTTKSGSLGLKTLNLKELNTFASSVKGGSKNAGPGGYDNNQMNLDLNFGKCKTDRPITSIETGRGIASTYNTTARRSPEERNISIVSDRRRGEEDTEIQHLIDMLEASKEEMTVFEASDWIKSEVQSKKEVFDAEIYMKNIMAKVKKTFKRSSGKRETWVTSPSEQRKEHVQGLVYGR